MNSVMDDNRMLTLASNERIPLKPHMRMVFEIRDLKHATPATVSRAGILYISTNQGTQWRSLIKSFVKQRTENDEVKVWLQELFDEYLADSLLWLLLNVKQVLPLEDMNIVQSMLYMLELLLTPRNTDTRENLEVVFNYCAVWALGADSAQKMNLNLIWWRRWRRRDVTPPRRRRCGRVATVSFLHRWTARHVRRRRRLPGHDVRLLDVAVEEREVSEERGRFDGF